MGCIVRILFMIFFFDGGVTAGGGGSQRNTETFFFFFFEIKETQKLKEKFLLQFGICRVSDRKSVV